MLYVQKVQEPNWMGGGMLEENLQKTKSNLINKTKQTDQELELERKEK